MSKAKRNERDAKSGQYVKSGTEIEKTSSYSN